MMMMICMMASTIMMANNGDGDVSLIDYPHDMRMNVMRRKISMGYMDSSSTKNSSNLLNRNKIR